MRTYFLKAVLVVCSISLMACSNQDNEKIKQLSQLESDASIESDREAAKKMEEDLHQQFEFYEQNSGHFEGWMIDGGTKFKIRISLFPNLPRYRGTRLRSQEEVRTDLSRIALNAQITQWNPDSANASVGCKVEGLRPDLKDGGLNIMSAACPSSYFLILNRTTITGTVQPSSHPGVFILEAIRKDRL